MKIMAEDMKATYHLPGLFEFYEFYKIFLPVFYAHREFFYEWCQIGSIYGAPAECLWGGGRAGYGENGIEKDVLALSKEFGFSVRLTLSNSMLEKEHLGDRKCNQLCSLFQSENNGIIVHSDLLLDYLRNTYPQYYFVSSTTKVLEDFDEFNRELNREEFSYVVPDFRLNPKTELLGTVAPQNRSKVEFLCNECCWFSCRNRKKCYEEVSRSVLGLKSSGWRCCSPESYRGYRFSDAMKNPAFIGIQQIKDVYMPMGFSNFKIEGRSLGSAMILEFLLYYMTKPEFQLQVRELIYLDNSLDLF